MDSDVLPFSSSPVVDWWMREEKNKEYIDRPFSSSAFFTLSLYIDSSTSDQKNGSNLHLHGKRVCLRSISIGECLSLTCRNYPYHSGTRIPWSLGCIKPILVPSTKHFETTTSMDPLSSNSAIRWWCVCCQPSGSKFNFSISCKHWSNDIQQNWMVKALLRPLLPPRWSALMDTIIMIESPVRSWPHRHWLRMASNTRRTRIHRSLVHARHRKWFQPWNQWSAKPSICLIQCSSKTSSQSSCRTSTRYFLLLVHRKMAIPTRTIRNTPFLISMHYRSLRIRFG